MELTCELELHKIGLETLEICHNSALDPDEATILGSKFKQALSRTSFPVLKNRFLGIHFRYLSKYIILLDEPCSGACEELVRFLPHHHVHLLKLLLISTGPLLHYSME